MIEKKIGVIVYNLCYRHVSIRFDAAEYKI